MIGLNRSRLEVFVSRFASMAVLKIKEGPVATMKAFEDLNVLRNTFPLKLLQACQDCLLLRLLLGIHLGIVSRLAQLSAHDLFLF